MHVYPKPDTDVVESNSDDPGMNEPHESSRRVCAGECTQCDRRMSCILFRWEPGYMCLGQ
jgi:hypothetical protein